MNNRQQHKASQKFNKYKNSASMADIKKIDSKLGGKNKGALKEVWDTVLQLWELMKDPNAAWSSKAIAIAALMYVVSPIDAIPDVIPVLGLTDDAAVIALAVTSLGTALKKYSK